MTMKTRVTTHHTPYWKNSLRTGFLGGLSLLVAAVSTNCGDMSTPPPVPAEAYASRPSATLAAGDELSVTFSGAPELNTKQKIQPNGKVSLPTVGDVTAAGRSATSLQSTLTSLYGAHLQDPTVIVSVEQAAAGVYVGGEVLRPGKIPLDRPMTALEAVMEAGGYTKFANPKKVMVVRNDGSHNQSYTLNLSPSGLGSAPFYLRKYDVIYVKQSNW